MAGIAIPDVALCIRIDDILHRRHPTPQRLPKLGTGPAAIHHTQSLEHRGMIQGGPSQCKRLFGKSIWPQARGQAGGQFVDDRTVPGHDHLLNHGRAAFDPDHFPAHLRVMPLTVELELHTVGSAAQMLNIEVLHVGVAIGEAPGHAPIMPRNHIRDAGEGDASDVKCVCFPGRHQVILVPNGRCAEWQMHVIGKEGSPGCGTGAGKDPVIAARQAAPCREVKIRPRGAGRLSAAIILICSVCRDVRRRSRLPGGVLPAATLS